MPAFCEFDDYSCTIGTSPGTGKSSPCDVSNIDRVTYCNDQMTRQIDVEPILYDAQSVPTYWNEQVNRSNECLLRID